ncbi:MAG: phosphatidylglycerophosphatase A, partial [Candidatus Aminicenantes bacterium]|nr:phosphatidylglycerophosphatase A [Candidatus Aminicenantes bacterium]
AWFPILSGFLLFRIFDIVKPYPIKKVETLPSGWGIMMDDIVAAIYAGVIINLYLIIK